MNSWTVYRHYDANGAALYVGCTSNLRARSYAHKQAAPWFNQVAGTETIRFKSKNEALAAETALIQALRPAHNKRTGKWKDPETKRTYMRTYMQNWLTPERRQAASQDAKKRRAGRTNAQKAKRRAYMRRYMRRYMRTYATRTDKRPYRKRLQSSGPQADPSTSA